ncbi:hypothetical protein ACH0CC_17320 [Virgibacillus pantothenticus]|uniref:hypothetical protein n=1 Tax=Virgibacillus pantothenticus TaxID=1473 RepID=UPI0020B1DF7B|nr:hypothetical protein [Virgibacillus pantothenticus]MEB5466084.1 hypothetical protein [Virgibacillus pantothenticus]
MEMLNWIRDDWTKPMAMFISEVFKEPDPSSSGRRRPEHKQILKKPWHNMKRDILHLDDLTYDPII